MTDFSGIRSAAKRWVDHESALARVRAGVARTCVAILFAIAPSLATAQPVPTRTLPPADARLTESFSHVISARELGDGTVLFVDLRDNRIMHADFARGAVRNVSRLGDGPGEYRKVAPLYALGADSTLMRDGSTPRWVLFAGASAVASVGPTTFPRAELRSEIVYGTDALGRVVSLPFPGMSSHRLDPTVDGPPIFRTDRATGAADSLGIANWMLDPTVAASKSGRAPGAVAGAEAAGSRATPRISRYALLVRVIDQVAVASDGFIAIARHTPYRVDWCDAQLRCRNGPVLSYPSRVISNGDKAAWIASEHARGHTWPPTTDVSRTAGWPDRLPPFTTPPVGSASLSALLIAPDGTALLRRMPAADAPATRYNVIGRDGRRLFQLALPINAEIVGVGAASVFVSTADEDGLQTISRHRWEGRR